MVLYVVSAELNWNLADIFWGCSAQVFQSFSMKKVMFHVCELDQSIRVGGQQSWALIILALMLTLYTL